MRVGSDTLSMTIMTLMPIYQVISTICGIPIYPRRHSLITTQFTTHWTVKATAGGLATCMSQTQLALLWAAAYL